MAANPIRRIRRYRVKYAQSQDGGQINAMVLPALALGGLGVLIGTLLDRERNPFSSKSILLGLLGTLLGAGFGAVRAGGTGAASPPPVAGETESGSTPPPDTSGSTGRPAAPPNTSGAANVPDQQPAASGSASTARQNAAQDSIANVLQKLHDGVCAIWIYATADGTGNDLARVVWRCVD